MHSTITTEHLPRHERLAYWQDVNDRMIAPREVSSSTDDFQARADVTQLGTLVLVSASCSAHQARRTPRLIRQSDPDLLHLSLNLRGRSHIAQAREQLSLQTGELALYEASRPFEGQAVPDGDLAAGVLVMIPRTALVLTSRIEPALPIGLSRAGGLGDLLSRFLAGLAGQAGSLGPADGVRLSLILLDLLTATLAQQIDVVPSTDPHKLSLLRLQEFMLRNLADPQLSPTKIANSCHVSVRQLHNIFRREGTTVSTWLRERRLDRCRRDLADPGLATMTIGAIATRWGYPDLAQFSRVFRATYGVPPSAYRSGVHRSPDVR